MKSTRTLILLFVLVNCCLHGYSQKERNTWCFGFNAGLDFSSGPPVSFSGSKMSTIEGCASISDKATGDLLFYTDGTTVYDRTNTIMAGDSVGLGGNYSTSQSAFILPMPGSDHEYYLFCTDQLAGAQTMGAGSGEDSGTQYCIIDMNLNGGYGAVAQQPKHLLAPACEKIAATFNADSTGYWLVIHLWNSDAFYTYPVTITGIGTPVISHSGIQANSPHDAGNGSAIGYMRISPDGNKIAAAWHDSINTVQVFNFDRIQGTVSEPILTRSGFGGIGPYGVCFSPSSQFLYFTVNAVPLVYQLNLNALSDTAVVIGHTDISSSPWAMQIGPDNKIYVAVEQENSVDCINYPDSAGLACHYQAFAVNLGFGTCRLGLPEFPPGFITKHLNSITNLVKEVGVSVYPNPSTGISQLSVDEELTGANFEVYDAEGRMVLQSKLQARNSKLNLDAPDGIYYLHISNNKVNVVRKLVKI